MPNRLPIPAELASLIEKREGSERRQNSDDDQPAADRTEENRTASDSADGPVEERRSGADRRFSEKGRGGARD